MEIKFMVDFMLGRLCRWLRLLGEDAEYYRDRDKGGIIYRSLKEKRIILTRDRRLSSKKAIRIYRVKNEEFREQLREVINEFDIEIDDEKIFSRCTDCNLILQQIQKEKIKNKVPDYVYKTHDKFSICKNCERIYWKGTHRELIDKVIKRIR
ncbi:MAG: Mut7-C RNAse domain-containing protein [Elusimicrobiota bacterium]